MNVTRLVSTAILLALTGFLGLFFTNCGQVQFQPPEASASDEKNTSEDGDVFKIDDETVSFDKLSQYDRELMDSRLSDEELDQFRPLSDLNDPSVRDLYFCPSSVDKYLICHLPGHPGAPAQDGCIPLSATQAHDEHDSVAVDDEGNMVEAYDYLGPCKH